jgi:hypothetical protein
MLDRMLAAMVCNDGASSSPFVRGAISADAVSHEASTGKSAVWLDFCPSELVD